jgi:Collagen triple helix repeat (20 copies)
MNSPRRHLSYTNVVATLALVFAMSGGALAASRYLITSTKQISPKVLRKLKGNTGATGANGATGAAGAPGAAGPKGPQGIQGQEGYEGYEGKPGTAVAYGAVGVSNNLDVTAPSWNVAAVSNPHLGVFCIRVAPPLTAAGINPRSHLLIATIRAENVGGFAPEVVVLDDFGGNCAESEWEVETRNLKASTISGEITATAIDWPFNFVIP